MKGAITSETAAALTLLTTWGRGNLEREEWIKNGTLLVIQSSVGVYVYDPGDWKEIAAWAGALEFAVSKNGSVLAIGYGRGKAVLWDYEADTHKEIDQGYDPEIARKWAVSYNPQDPVMMEIRGERVFSDTLALSDDGRRLAIAGRDSRIGIWNTEEGSPAGLMSSKAAPPANLAAFSPGAGWLVTDGVYPNLVAWDLEKKAAVIRGSTMTGGFSDTPFSPDGTLLATFDNNIVLIWDFAAQSRIARMWTNLKWIRDAVFSADGEYIIVNDYEMILRASDGTSMPVDTLPKPEKKQLPDMSPLASEGFMAGSITGVSLGQDGNPLAWGYNGWTGPQWFWRIAENAFEAPDWSHCENIRTGFNFHKMVDSPEGAEYFLQAISPDCSLKAEVVGKSIQVFRMSDQTLLHGLSTHTGDISVLVFSPGGKYFASGASARLAPNELVLWRADPAVGLWKTSSGEGYVSEICFSQDETVMAVASDQIRLWRTDDQWLLGSISRSTNAMAFSPDGKILAVAGMGGSIALYSVPDLEQLVELQGPPGSGNYVRITSLAFTPDGAGLMAGLSAGTVQLWGIPAAG